MSHFYKESPEGAFTWGEVYPAFKILQGLSAGYTRRFLRVNRVGLDTVRVYNYRHLFI